MTNAEQPTDAAAPTDAPRSDAPQTAPVEDKGKGKIVNADDAMEEDDDDDDEEGEDEEEEAEDDDMEEEDEYQEIDAGAILPQGRRTRGVKVDYTSPEALKKAGLDSGDGAEADEEDEFKDVAA
ncbi:hypothetical protein JB92DRAFT_2054898 [Gautieria morchelliformis]|nr:hypothetical protein JB92DRAFT_2054898 [Gautieria morchelliformis]